MSVKYHISNRSNAASYEYEAPVWADRLPASTPICPGVRLSLRPSSIEEREIAAAHHALDALGVPAVADIDVTGEDETEIRLATHDLRLHGRIEFLAQRLGELGIPQPFEDNQAGQITSSPE